MKAVIREQMERFYDDGMPNYVVDAGKSFITIKTGADWMGGPKDHKITITDVVEYFCSQAPNLLSGCRTIGTLTGDWRPIDHLAHECLEWFKRVNIEVLRRESKKAGLTPKF